MGFLTDLASNIKTWVESNFSASNHNHNLNDLAEKSYNSLTDKPALGEANTASNLGAGEGVFAQKNGVALELKSILSSKNTKINATATDLSVLVNNNITEKTVSQIYLDGGLDFSNQSAYKVVLDDVFWDALIDVSTIETGEEALIVFDNQTPATPRTKIIHTGLGSSINDNYGKSFIMPKYSKAVVKIHKTTASSHNASLLTLILPREYNQYNMDLTTVYAAYGLAEGDPINWNGERATGDQDVLGVVIEDGSLGDLLTVSVNGVCRIKIGARVSTGDSLQVWFGKAYPTWGSSVQYVALADGVADDVILAVRS